MQGKAPGMQAGKINDQALPELLSQQGKAWQGGFDTQHTTHSCLAAAMWHQRTLNA